ncbi:MAG: prepilin-type N-terminal cleavage/methylation domain-containing protein [Patescibacteria group bacterium]
MKKNTKYQKGFGLVEVMVSLSILALVMLGLVTLGRAAYGSFENARNRSIAYNIIQDTMENIRNERDTNIGSAGTTWFTGIDQATLDRDNPVLDTRFKRTVTITDEASGRKKKVMVVISWPERTGIKTLSASTYFTDWKSKY